jgi:ATP-dependent DNA helicase Q1
VADALKDWSNGEIKVSWLVFSLYGGAEALQTGVYHAGVDDWQKEKIHVDWRKGRIKYFASQPFFGIQGL